MGGGRHKWKGWLHGPRTHSHTHTQPPAATRTDETLSNGPLSNVAGSVRTTAAVWPRSAIKCRRHFSFAPLPLAALTISAGRNQQRIHSRRRCEETNTHDKHTRLFAENAAIFTRNHQRTHRNRTDLCVCVCVLWSCSVWGRLEAHVKRRQRQQQRRQQTEKRGCINHIRLRTVSCEWVFASMVIVSSQLRVPLGALVSVARVCGINLINLTRSTKWSSCVYVCARLQMGVQLCSPTILGVVWSSGVVESGNCFLYRQIQMYAARI